MVRVKYPEKLGPPQAATQQLGTHPSCASFRRAFNECAAETRDSSCDGELQDLRISPSNRLEKLSGDRRGQYSIRIDDQWRIYLGWQTRDAYQVEITDYH